MNARPIRLHVPLALLLAGAACNTASSGRSGSADPGAGLSPGSVATTAAGAVASAGGNVPGTNLVPASLPQVSNEPYIAVIGGANNAYTLVGRFDTTVPDAPTFSLPNSKIGGSFTGDSLALILSGTGWDAVAVRIDARPEVVIATTPTAVATPYPVATGLGPGVHTAWVVKRTESYETSQIDPNQHTGTFTFGGFVLAPGATMQTPPASKTHLIMALGSSGFTGYGADQLETAAQGCVFSPQTQNALASIPAKLALLLDAEVFNVSASGKGVAGSAYDPNNPNNQLPALWQMTVPFKKDPVYPFPVLPVDAIILDGGGDDLIGAYGAGAFANTDAFVSRYTALLSDMRQHYPNALIVGIVNPGAIQQDKVVLTQAISAAVHARAQAGDAKVFAYDYFAHDPNGWVSLADAENALGFGHGCQGHASDAGATFLASRIAAFLRAPTPLQ